MRWYSDVPSQRGREIAADVVAGVLIVTWIVLGAVVGGVIAALGAIGRSIADTGTELKGSLDELGVTLGQIPLVGGAIAAPVEQAGASGQSLIDLGIAVQGIIAVTALIAGLTVALGPILVTACVWLVPRWLRMRRAQELRELMETDGGVDIERYLDLVYRRAGVRRSRPNAPSQVPRQA